MLTEYMTQRLSLTHYQRALSVYATTPEQEIEGKDKK